MIIFDLDGCIADCEHRRHFVDPEKAGAIEFISDSGKKRFGYGYKEGIFQEWKPDWKSFYEACELDKPILPVIKILNKLAKTMDIQIWSGRCESVREKTEHWLEFNCFPFRISSSNLKMRPEGDNTPLNELKKMWLRSSCSHISLNIETGEETWSGHGIDFLFDSDPASIAMYRRRGIFVFDCNQTGKE